MWPQIAQILRIGSLALVIRICEIPKICGLWKKRKRIYPIYLIAGAVNANKVIRNKREFDEFLVSLRP